MADLRVPELSEFKLSDKTGFLPEKPPLRRLSGWFECWEVLMDDLPRLTATGEIRDKIHQLPLLRIGDLDQPSIRRVYVVLSFLAHAYVWADLTGSKELLPAPIAVPWFDASDRLGLKPVISYAGVDILNYALINDNGDLSLSMLHTFTGTRDEEWFLLISLGIEARGGPILKAIMKCLNAMTTHDESAILESLQSLGQELRAIKLILERMPEKDANGDFLNDPEVFYNRIRPYMAGWENAISIPNGLIYQGVKGETGQDLQLKYAGASAGQSPILHCLDIILGIKHHPTRLNSPQEQPKNLEHKTTYIYEMRKYMLREHREFLSFLETTTNIKDYMEQQQRQFSDEMKPHMLSAFNDLVNTMKEFRDFHIQLITRYILIPSSKSKEVARGTGGTDLVPFLKQMRDETEEAKVKASSSKTSQIPKLTSSSRFGLRKPTHLAVRIDGVDGLEGEASTFERSKDDYAKLVRCLESEMDCNLQSSIIQMDYLFDTPEHALWAKGYTLLLRSSVIEGDLISPPSCSLVLKEIVVGSGSSAHPYVELKERNEMLAITEEEIRTMLETKVLCAGLLNSSLFREATSTIQPVHATIIGGWRNRRTRYQRTGLPLELDKTDFSFGQGYFFRFNADQERTTEILEYLQKHNIFYAVNMASKSDLLFANFHMNNNANPTQFQSNGNNQDTLPQQYPSPPSQVALPTNSLPSAKSRSPIDSNATFTVDSRQPIFQEGAQSVSSGSSRQQGEGSVHGSMSSSMNDVQRKKNRDASARYRRRKQLELDSYKEEVQKLRRRVEQLEYENSLLKTRTYIPTANNISL